MRLNKIEIIHFGKLSNVQFELDKNLSIFLGSNEAGKSTIVAFIKQILFGFHLKSKKTKFFEDYFPLDHVSPMGGKLYFQNGSDNYVLKRLYAKGDSKKGVLTVTLNGQEVPEATFFDLIKNISADFYTDSYIFNQDLLAEVTGLNEKELIERIYFLGASQSNQLLDLRDKYADAASEAFKPTGKKPVINHLLTDLKSQKEQVAQTSKEYEVYHQLDQEQHLLLDRLKQLQEQLSSLKKKQQQLQILQTKEKNFTEYQNLQGQFHPINFSQESFDKANNLEREIKANQEKLAKLDSQVQKIKLDSPQINLEQVQNILDQKAEFLQWQSQLDNLVQQTRRIEDEIKRLERFQPDLVQLKQYDEQNLAELKADYYRAKQELQAPKKQSSIVSAAISGLVFLVGLILLFSQQNLLISLLLIVGGLGAGIYFLKRPAVQTAAQSTFQSKYPFNLNNFDLDSNLNQLINLLSKEEELTHEQTLIKELKQKIQTFVGQVSLCLNHEVSGEDQVKNALSSLQKLLEKKKDSEFTQKNLENQIQATKLALKEDEGQLNKLLLANKVESLSEFQESRNEYLKQEKIKLKLDTLKNNLDQDLKELQEYRQNNNLGTELTSLKQAISEQTDKVNELQQEIANIKAKQNNLADSDAVFKNNQQLANLKARLREESSDYLSNLLVSSWINRSLDLASNERFPKMLESAKSYFKLLTAGRYVDLNFNKSLSVTNKDNKKLKVQYLSRGTSEQLYFALKLAFVEQIADEISLPVLIDDAFVNFDQQRIENIIKLLELLVKKTQVIIFTQRSDLAKQLNGKLINLNQEN
ncbi:ATP-binding protein [Lactobacillus sp. PV034]|uniref:ATP-binding protein n=1 Tax=Lactobacillus sp. PV034 TaxID=2594495 RepID=UPI00224095C2|nr:AAA family ATPase [Lactobacillus sp. PV034]QNQ80101.1 AAA family ATPase [Lactobacillus sp. PV034]